MSGHFGQAYGLLPPTTVLVDPGDYGFCAKAPVRRDPLAETRRLRAGAALPTKTPGRRQLSRVTTLSALDAVIEQSQARAATAETAQIADNSVIGQR